MAWYGMVWQVCDPLVTNTQWNSSIFNLFIYFFFPVSQSLNLYSLSYSFDIECQAFESSHLSCVFICFISNFHWNSKTISQKSLLKLKSRIKIIFRMKLMHVLKSSTAITIEWSPVPLHTIHNITQSTQSLEFHRIKLNNIKIEIKQISLMEYLFDCIFL